MITPLAGGWEQAAQLPLEDALDLAVTHLRAETLRAFQHAQQCWFSSLGAYANGGTPQKPPELPDEDE